MNSSIQKNFAAFKQALDMLKGKSFRPYLLLPIVINAVLLTAFVYWGSGYFADLISDSAQGWQATAFWDWINGAINATVEFLIDVLHTILLVLFFLVGAVLFSTTAQIIGGPFYAKLSERVDVELSGTALPEVDFITLIKRTLARELSKFYNWFKKLILLSIISFFIMLTPLSPLLSILWAVFGAWVMAIQYFDYHADNNGKPVEYTLDMLSNNKMLTLIFGGIILLITMIPLANLIIIPLGVTASTIIWHSQILQKK